MDAFTRLSLPARFSLDELELERAQAAQLAALHPARLLREVGINDADFELLRQQRQLASEAVNLARRELACPVRRAELLLGLRGIACSSGKSEPLLLERILEQRELLEEARGARELERVEQVFGAARRRRDALVAELAAWLDQPVAVEPQVDPLLDCSLEAARVVSRLDELRYVQRLLEAAERALDELDL